MGYKKQLAELPPGHWYQIWSVSSTTVLYWQLIGLYCFYIYIYTHTIYVYFDTWVIYLMYVYIYICSHGAGFRVRNHAVASWAAIPSSQQSKIPNSQCDFPKKWVTCISQKKRGPLTQLHLDTPFLGGQLLQPSRLLYLWIGLIGLMITLHMVIW